MAATKGNQFWLKRATHGRKTIFETPAAMLEAAYEYFLYESKKVWNIKEAIKAGEFSGQLVDVPIHNPFTFEGLCIFIHTNTKYFVQFETGLQKKLSDKELSDIDRELAEDFSNAVSHIRDVINKQKIDGALVGAYNAAIASKLVGLIDKTSTELTGKDGGKIEFAMQQITGIKVE